MPSQNIRLNRAVADNAGLFCDAGSVLTVGDDAVPGTISSDRAAALIDQSGAEPLPLAMPKAAVAAAKSATTSADDAG